MLNIGAGELIFILVVALLVLGPQRLPEFARGIGRFFREFRRQTDDVRTMVEREFYRMDQDVLDERVPPPPPPIPAGKLAPPPAPPVGLAGSSSPAEPAPVPAEAPAGAAGSPPPSPSSGPAQAESLPQPAPPPGTVARGSPQGDQPPPREE